jgi:hypothetical protein
MTPAILSQTELTAGRTVSHGNAEAGFALSESAATHARTARKSNPSRTTVWNVVRANKLLLFADPLGRFDRLCRLLFPNSIA